MADTYLGVIYCCTCCRLRMDECRCPCDSIACGNRVARPIDRALYGIGPVIDYGSTLARLDDGESL